MSTVYIPAVPVEGSVTNTFYGAHLLPYHVSDHDYQQFSRIRPKTAKIVWDSPEMFARFYKLSPQTLFVCRNHPLSERKAEMKANPIVEAQQDAAFWDSFLNQVEDIVGAAHNSDPANNPPFQRHKFVCLGKNEPYVEGETDPIEHYQDWIAQAQENQRILVDYTNEFMLQLAFKKCRSGAFNLSVGQPTNYHIKYPDGSTAHGIPGAPPDWSILAGVEDQIKTGVTIDGVWYWNFLVLHAYWDHRGPIPADDPELFRWYAGRYTQCPLHVPIIFGEYGLDEYVTNAGVDKLSRGWQAQLNGNFPLYQSQINQFIGEIRKDIRCFDGEIYTWDFSDPWGTFNVRDQTPYFPANDDFNEPLLRPVWSADDDVSIPVYPIGIDVSEHQGDINWAEVVPTSVDFAFIRGSIGSGGVDSKFHENWAQANILKAMYHVVKPDQSARGQVINIDSVLSPFGKDMLIALDVELKDDNVTPQDLSCLVKDIVVELVNLGYQRPIIYTGAWFWNDNVKGCLDWWPNYSLWVASYTPDPIIPNGWHDWLFWQYTNKGSIPGITGDVDLSYFQGTFEQLHELFTSYTAEPDITPDTALALAWAARDHAKLAINPDAALFKRMIADECFPISDEFSHGQFILQCAKTLDGKQNRVYYVKNGQWDSVGHIVL